MAAFQFGTARGNGSKTMTQPKVEEHPGVKQAEMPGLETLFGPQMNTLLKAFKLYQKIAFLFFIIFFITYFFYDLNITQVEYYTSKSPVFRILLTLAKFFQFAETTDDEITIRGP